MSRNKYPLTTQTTKLFIVIRKEKELNIDLLKSYCNEFFVKYVLIEHKNDIDPLSGLQISPHYHIVGTAKKSKTPLKTHMNDCIRFMRFDNEVGLSFDKYDDETKAIQYLIHKNNPEKTQHTFDELIYNYDKQELMLILASEQSEIISFDMVYSVCMKHNNMLEVIREIGFKTYHKYRNTIWDMWQMVKAHKERIFTDAESKRLPTHE